jgi:secreted trypsin-like serine protease
MLACVLAAGRGTRTSDLAKTVEPSVNTFRVQLQVAKSMIFEKLTGRVHARSRTNRVLVNNSRFHSRSCLSHHYKTVGPLCCDRFR